MEEKRLRRSDCQARETRSKWDAFHLAQKPLARVDAGTTMPTATKCTDRSMNVTSKGWKNCRRNAATAATPNPPTAATRAGANGRERRRSTKRLMPSGTPRRQNEAEAVSALANHPSIRTETDPMPVAAVAAAGNPQCEPRQRQQRPKCRAADSSGMPPPWPKCRSKRADELEIELGVAGPTRRGQGPKTTELSSRPGRRPRAATALRASLVAAAVAPAPCSPPAFRSIDPSRPATYSPLRRVLGAFIARWTLILSAPTELPLSRESSVSDSSRSFTSSSACRAPAAGRPPRGPAWSSRRGPPVYLHRGRKR